MKNTTFIEFINEAKGTQNKAKFTAFEIFIDDISHFITNSGNGADIINKKLQTKKFKDVENIKILRHNEKGSEDVTDLFIK